MICLTCDHYSNPDREMEREQRSSACTCRCHPWNKAAEDAVPQTHCPACGVWQDDLDGFGVLHCRWCGYCQHPSINGDVCGLCGQTVPDV